MPHDANGNRLNVGDFVRTKPYNNSTIPVVGRIVKLVEAETCSGEIVWPEYGGVVRDYFGAITSELVCYRDGTSPLVVPPEEDITV